MSQSVRGLLQLLKSPGSRSQTEPAHSTFRWIQTASDDSDRQLHVLMYIFSLMKALLTPLPPIAATWLSLRAYIILCFLHPPADCSHSPWRAFTSIIPVLSAPAHYALQEEMTQSFSFTVNFAFYICLYIIESYYAEIIVPARAENNYYTHYWLFFD